MGEKANGGQSAVTGREEREAKSGTEIAGVDCDARKTGQGAAAVNLPSLS